MNHSLTRWSCKTKTALSRNPLSPSKPETIYIYIQINTFDHALYKFLLVCCDKLKCVSAVSVTTCVGIACLDPQLLVPLASD